MDYTLDLALLVTTFRTKKAVLDLEAFFKFPCTLKVNNFTKTCKSTKINIKRQNPTKHFSMLNFTSPSSLMSQYATKKSCYFHHHSSPIRNTTN